MIGFFKYAACPNMVLGISDQQTGAQVVLKSVNSEMRMILWSVNDRTGEIKLAASEDLVMDASGTYLTLQTRDINKASQKWDMATTRGFIRSKQNSNYVIDSFNRGTYERNPIIIYPFNGSEAQQWKFVPMDMLSINNVAEEVMAEDDPLHA